MHPKVFHPWDKHASPRHFYPDKNAAAASLVGDMFVPMQRVIDKKSQIQFMQFLLGPDCK